jgi:hypothetical protein
VENLARNCGKHGLIVEKVRKFSTFDEGNKRTETVKIGERQFLHFLFLNSDPDLWLL